MTKRRRILCGVAIALATATGVIALTVSTIDCTGPGCRVAAPASLAATRVSDTAACPVQPCRSIARCNGSNCLATEGTR